MHFSLCSTLISVGSLLWSAACTGVFDYRLDDTKTSDADTRSGPSEVSSPNEIGRRNHPQADGGAARSLDAAGAADGVKADPARPGQMGGSDTNTNTDDDAGVNTNTVDPPTTAPPQTSAAHQQAGWAALTDWAGLPTFSTTSTRLFSTHERGVETSFPLIDPGNKDFNSFLALCGDQPSLVGQQNEASVSCGPGENGYLIAADDGPGYISRILLARGISNPTSSVLVDLRPMSERIRIYIDGAETPAFEGRWSDWADTLAAPFDAPLTAWTSGGTISYLPISYSRQLRVFIDDLSAGSSLTLYYAHVNTHHVEATESFDAAQLAAPEARAELDALLAQPRAAGVSWLDQDVAVQGVGAWAAWTREQPGTLQRVELQLEAATARAVMDETSLRLSWDGSAAVDLPLSLLFGARHALASFTTLPLSVELDGDKVQLKLSLPMPFAQRASVELVSATDAPRNIRVRLYGNDELPRGEWGRLHAALSELSEPEPGDRFSAAALSGRGKYIGTLMYMRGKTDASRSPRADELGFMEGDERLEIDGEVRALGTGTDNYFNGGFFFKNGPYSSPFSAVSQLAVDDEQGTSETTMMRWTILSEAVNFDSELTLSFELGADRPETVRDYAAVSFFYQ